MKKFFILCIGFSLFLTNCKRSIPEPTRPWVESDLIGYWYNYDHFTYNSTLDTTFSDTNQFIMMDLDITDLNNLTKYYRDGSDPRPHTYDTTTARINIYSNTFKVTYKMEFNGLDSLTLSSLPRPQGGIPFPGSDQEIWVFVKR
ncbi:MAG: hypothetical protein ACI9GM_000744 [Salibacteraceae bacterium]|jgi:hypothetical protein